MGCVLTASNWFLSDIDFDDQLMRFVVVDEARLNAAAFHDGRVDLSATSHPSKILPFSAIQEMLAHIERNNAPLRLIAHVGYCGSTLLSRLLDVPGAITCYREPQALVHLAMWAPQADPDKADLDKADPNSVGLKSDILDTVIHKFKTPIGDATSAVVKMSNWVNGLAPALTERAGDVRMIVIDLALEDFLLAHLRGGRERIRLSLEFLNHVTSYSQHDQQSAIDIQSSKLPDFQKLLRLLSLLLAIQRRALDAAAVNSHSVLRLSKHEILTDPCDAAERAANALELPIEESAIDANYARFRERSAKSDTADRFAAKEENEKNQFLQRKFADDLRAALSWAERTGLNIERAA